MSGKLGVSKQSVPPGIKSDATLLAAVHLLLALRSIVAPATAAGNVRAEERFTTWILKYPGRWECVKRVIESQRLQCTVSREWDLSTSFPRIEQMVWELASQPTLLRGDKDRGPSKQLQRKEDKDYALTADEYKAVKSKCFDSSRCLKFQTGKCDQSGDHDGREHRCASCDVVGHGSATCPQRKPGPAQGRIQAWQGGPEEGERLGGRGRWAFPLRATMLHRPSPPNPPLLPPRAMPPRQPSPEGRASPSALSRQPHLGRSPWRRPPARAVRPCVRAGHTVYQLCGTRTSLPARCGRLGRPASPSSAQISRLPCRRATGRLSALDTASTPSAETSCWLTSPPVSPRAACGVSLMNRPSPRLARPRRPRPR